MKSWKDIGFEIEITGDGSPSLHLLTPSDPAKKIGESMHHSGGACAETNLIYGEPITAVLGFHARPHFMVVGLGLGYIELVIAREALKVGKSPSQLGLLTSYESVPELRNFFVAWIGGSQDLHSEVQGTYDLVAECVLKDTSITSTNLKTFLTHFFKSESDIHAALEADCVFESKYHCILYDAFSAKTTPTLWSEEFLNHLLKNATAETSVMSTYACRGSLKRALRNQGFEVITREGFQGKRNSTLGYKNYPTSFT